MTMAATDAKDGPRIGDSWFDAVIETAVQAWINATAGIKWPESEIGLLRLKMAPMLKVLVASMPFALYVEDHPHVLELTAKLKDEIALIHRSVEWARGEIWDDDVFRDRVTGYQFAVRRADEDVVAFAVRVFAARSANVINS